MRTLAYNVVVKQNNIVSLTNCHIDWHFNCESQPMEWKTMAIKRVVQVEKSTNFNFLRFCVYRKMLASVQLCTKSGLQSDIRFPANWCMSFVRHINWIKVPWLAFTMFLIFNLPDCVCACASTSYSMCTLDSITSYSCTLQYDFFPVYFLQSFAWYVSRTQNGKKRVRSASKIN